MIFSSPAARLVRRGKKTRHMLLNRGEPCRYKPQVVYAVQTPANRTADGHVVMLEVVDGFAGELSFDDAKAEGVRSTDEAKAAYVREWCKPWVAREVVRREEEPELAEMVTRFDRSLADRRVFVLRFQLESDRPIFLHRDSSRGYTSSWRDALEGEQESMSPDLLHSDWAQRATAHHDAAMAVTHAERLSGLTHPDERNVELRRIATELGIDVASEVKRVDLTRKAHERAVRALERKVRKDEAA